MREAPAPERCCAHLPPSLAHASLSLSLSRSSGVRRGARHRGGDGGWRRGWRRARRPRRGSPRGDAGAIRVRGVAGARPGALACVCGARAVAMEGGAAVPERASPRPIARRLQGSERPGWRSEALFAEMQSTGPLWRLMRSPCSVSRARGGGASIRYRARRQPAMAASAQQRHCRVKAFARCNGFCNRARPLPRWARRVRGDGRVRHCVGSGV